jgi:very-short-patch-repair endonuclease
MSPTKVSDASIGNARRLRREMTEGEKRLWIELKQLRGTYGIHVRKQVPIGLYVADFAIHSAKLIIEVDGHFHQETARQQSDAARDHWLMSAGYRVLRFSTGDLDEIESVINSVLRELKIS